MNNNREGEELILLTTSQVILGNRPSKGKRNGTASSMVWSLSHFVLEMCGDIILNM
jgi:hypothetical protein